MLVVQQVVGLTMTVMLIIFLMTPKVVFSIETIKWFGLVIISLLFGACYEVLLVISTEKMELNMLHGLM